MTAIDIRVQTDDFAIQDEYNKLRESADNAGAIATFTGLVREFYASSKEEADDPQNTGSNEKVECLELEHYPGMTEKAMTDIAVKAAERWSLSGATVVHRVGKLSAGDQIVFVACASNHRQDAFDAAQFIMDFMKSKAPFWKKQRSSEGERWIASRSSDEKALDRW